MGERIIVATPTGTVDVEVLERRGQWAVTRHPDSGLTITHVPSGYAIPWRERPRDTISDRRWLGRLLVALEDVPAFELAERLASDCATHWGHEEVPEVAKWVWASSSPLVPCCNLMVGKTRILSVYSPAYTGRWRVEIAGTGGRSYALRAKGTRKGSNNLNAGPVFREAIKVWRQRAMAERARLGKELAAVDALYFADGQEEASDA